MKILFTSLLIIAFSSENPGGLVNRIFQNHDTILSLQSEHLIELRRMTKSLSHPFQCQELPGKIRLWVQIFFPRLFATVCVVPAHTPFIWSSFLITWLIQTKQNRIGIFGGSLLWAASAVPLVGKLAISSPRIQSLVHRTDEAAKNSASLWEESTRTLNSEIKDRMDGARYRMCAKRITLGGELPISSGVIAIIESHISNYC